MEVAKNTFNLCVVSIAGAGAGSGALIYSKVRPSKQKIEDCRAEWKSNAGKMFCEYLKTVFFLNKKCSCFKKNVCLLCELEWYWPSLKEQQTKHKGVYYIWIY